MTTPLIRLTPIMSALLLLSCASPDSTGRLPAVSSIPAGVSKEGTIANAKLVEDATTALFTKLQISEVERPTVKVLKFVIQQPVGPVGKKAWREMWVLMKDGKPGRQFIVTFQENGFGAADFQFSE